MKGGGRRTRNPWLRMRTWAAFAAIAGTLAFATEAGRLPDPAPLAMGMPGATAYMRARGPSPDVPAAVPLEALSPVLVCAVVKAEDRRFFRHRGFAWRQIGKAVARRGRMGGSTITQQLARNLYLGPERTLRRKAREALIARRLEDALPKRRILELYLGVIEWGDGVWGAEAAARRYFGTGAARLEPWQAVFLAGLVAAPRTELRGANAERAATVQLRVADQLYRAGVLDADQWRAVRVRLADVHAALRAGAALEEALRTPPAARPVILPAPARAQGVALPAARAVAAECGLENELRSERMIQETLR